MPKNSSRDIGSIQMRQCFLLFILSELDGKDTKIYMLLRFETENRIRGENYVFLPHKFFSQIIKFPI